MAQHWTQAITRKNNEPVHWRMCAWLGFIMLNMINLFIFNLTDFFNFL